MTRPQTADQVIDVLAQGNERWIAGVLTAPNRTSMRRENMARNGQKPFAAVLSCSDSRVDPVVLFDQGLGDLFVVRVAGNVAGEDVLGSLAYAVHALETPLVLVLGHTDCGALTAALSGKEVPEGMIRTLVEKLKPVADEALGRCNGCGHADTVDHAVELNVRQVCKDIPRDSPVIREAMKKGKVRIAGAIYDLETGRVNWLDDQS